MSYETACACIDWIFKNQPKTTNSIEIQFIGGEPLLEFELEKKVYEYTINKYKNKHFIFYATTNGVLLNSKMKKWFDQHCDKFVLGLSLDGLPESHNFNRSNSYNKIDIKYFIKTWPNQGIKMTISEHSLYNLADNVIYLHELGFNEINGVNLFEGTFDWREEKYIKVLIPQLKKLVSYYVEHDDLMLDQMMGRRIDLCEEKNRLKRKWCGIGTGTVFFDTDGKRYPCPFVTPMTFKDKELEIICATDFNKTDNFIDDDCFLNCYIYPICPMCPGANYLSKKSFKERDRSKCRIQKLIALYCADLQAKRILKNSNCVDKTRIYNTITAIEKIKEKFLFEFSEYKDIM